jgi:DNA-binding LacI/PurR family transcriptional regulator
MRYYLFTMKRSHSDCEPYRSRVVAELGDKRSPTVSATGGAAGSRPADALRPMRPPTIRDVAHLADVSYQTVSRVLNDHPSVRDSTRTRVAAAIEQLGYRPNNAARALVTGKTQTIGVVALDVADWSGLTTLYGIERSARETGYFVSIANLPSVGRASVRHAVSRLVEQGVAGLLVIAPVAAGSDALSELSTDIPVVAIEGDPDAEVASITVDQISGARAATEHLVELGHETVFHVSGPLDWMQTQERVVGWRAALEAAGAEVTMPLAGDWSAKSGYEVGRMLARIPELSAVFVGNDQMSLGTLLALSERNLSVPGDVSVVGFDDIPEAAYFRPPLTTVRQDFQEVGRQALQMLTAQIETGALSTERRVIESQLIIRSSTGPARARTPGAGA